MKTPSLFVFDVVTSIPFSYYDLAVYEVLLMHVVPDINIWCLFMLKSLITFTGLDTNSFFDFMVSICSLLNRVKQDFVSVILNVQALRFLCRPALKIALTRPREATFVLSDW